MSLEALCAEKGLRMTEQRKTIGGVDPSRAHRVALDLVREALPGRSEALHQDLAHAVVMSAR